MPTEEDLCREFGIGRSSVREAIKTLESRGMVRKLHGKGVEVIDESAKATTEMLHISVRMESFYRLWLKLKTMIRLCCGMIGLKNLYMQDMLSRIL